MYRQVRAPSLPPSLAPPRQSPPAPIEELTRFPDRLISCRQLLMILVLPWLVVGVALFVPVPSLALHAAQAKVHT